MSHRRPLTVLLLFTVLSSTGVFAQERTSSSSPSNERPAVVRTVEGRELIGRLKFSQGDPATLTVTPLNDEATDANNAADQPAKPISLSLLDVDQVLLRPDLRSSKSDIELIDGDGEHDLVTRTGTIKLRKGLHRITVPFWHDTGNQKLKLEYSGPDTNRREVAGSAFKHVTDDAQRPASPGVDDQGFRLPEDPPNTRRRIHYRYYKAQPDSDWSSLQTIFPRLNVERTGTTDRIGLRVARGKTGFGLLFTGYLNIETDGQYTFALTSSGRAAMYLGKPPLYIDAAGRSSANPRQTPWRIHLADHGTLEGRIDQWSDAGFQVQCPSGGKQSEPLTLNVPQAQVRSVWANGFNPDTLNLANDSRTLDLAFIMPKPEDQEQDEEQDNATESQSEQDSSEHNSDTPALAQRNFDPARIRRVSGRAMGFKDGALVFQYRGQARQVALERLAGLVLRREHANEGQNPDAAGPKFHQRLALLSGQTIPGQWKALKDASVRFQTPWSESLSVPADRVRRIRMVNGRLVPLTELDPTQITQTPYFDRIPPYRVNESLTGKPIRLFTAHSPVKADGTSAGQGQRFERGISVHSRTRLGYTLGGEFERFMTTVGLQKPGGRRGNVAVRVIGDDKTLFEQKQLTAEDGPIPIDVSVKGVQRLSLEIDFGKGQNVGDRAVWARPRLIREGRTQPAN